MSEKTGKKGYALEELLRAYFIRAGVFAVRGVPVRIEGDELTDVDIWLYERPTGSSRRRQIVDAKSKLKPKAVERLFWTKGLCDLLQVDGAYIATTDTRPVLGEISRRLNVSVLDGADLKKISASDKILIPGRLTEEDIVTSIKKIDQVRRTKKTQNAYIDLKSSLIDNFGAGTVSRALEHLSAFLHDANTCHPESEGAEIFLRLAYLSASFCAIAMDYALTKVSFKSLDERRKVLQNVIRYGHDDENQGLENVRVAVALIEKFSINGSAAAQNIMRAAKAEYNKIPAEIISEYVIGHVKMDGLFKLARLMEMRAFSFDLLGFDDLPSEEKSFFAVLLDFLGISRMSVAKSWKLSSDVKRDVLSSSILLQEDIGPLFDMKTDLKRD